MPTHAALALCTATVTSASTGSSITEATYTGYARLDFVANWTAATTSRCHTVCWCQHRGRELRGLHGRHEHLHFLCDL